MTESLYSSLGALTLPPNVADVGDSLQTVLDPALDKLVELFAAVITAELGAVFDLAKVGTSLAGVDVVQTKLPMAPSVAVLQRYKAAMPLLCVCRDGKATWDELTLHEERMTQQWSVDYVVGPLSLDDERKLGSIAVAALKAIRGTVSRGYHPAFEGGAYQFRAAYLGDDVIADGSGGARFSKVRLVESTIGKARFADSPDSPEYLAASLVLETEEIEEDADIDPMLDGASFSVGIGGLGGIQPALSNFTTE